MNVTLKILFSIIIFILVILLFLIIRFQIWKIKENKLGWRTRPLGRDSISYEEKINGTWKKIEIDSEILLGKKRKVLYFKTEQEWTQYPKWAQHRKEIIQRIKINFPEKNTAYEND